MSYRIEGNVEGLPPSRGSAEFCEHGMHRGTRCPACNDVCPKCLLRGTHGVGCIKCGSTDIATTWHEDKWACGYDSRQRFPTMDGEHLHKHCRGCHFEWSIPPNDAKE